MSKLRAILSILVLVGVLSGSVAALTYQEVLPPETLAHLSVANLTNLAEKAKKVPLYGLFQDPEMKPLLDAVKAQIAEDAGISPESLNDPDETITALIGAAAMKGIIPPELSEEVAKALKAPKGQIIVALTGINIEEESVSFAVMIDMGEANQALKKIVLEGLGKMSPEEATVAKTTVRDEEVYQVTINNAAPPLKTFSLAFPGKTFYFGNDPKVLDSLVVSGTESGRPGVNGTPPYQKVMSKVDSVNDVEIFANIPEILKILQKAAAEEDPNSAVVFRAFGAECIGPMGASLAIDDNGRIHQKSYLSMPGELKGIAKIIAQKNQSHEPQSFIPAEADTYFAMSLDWSDLIRQVETIFQEISPEEYEGFQEGLKQNLSSMGAGDNFDLKADLFDLMGQDLEYYTYIDESGEEKEQEVVVTAALKDASAFEASVSKLTMMVAMFATFQKRDYQGSPIYDLMMMGQPTGGGYTIAGGRIAGGKIASLEKMIRDLSGDQKGLMSSEAYLKFTASFPKQVTMLSYSNDAKSVEYFVRKIKEEAGLGMMDLLMKIDLSEIELPKPETIAKYFGYTVQYAEWQGDGLYSSGVSFLKL